MASLNYKEIYEIAKRDLAELIKTQEQLERTKIQLRKTIEALAAQCASENIPIEPSREAALILQEASLADEIRTLLVSHYPGWLRPHEIKAELERLGHDLGRFNNPQATIQMVLKRLTEAKTAEVAQDSNRKQVYRFKQKVLDGVPLRLIARNKK